MNSNGYVVLNGKLLNDEFCSCIIVMDDKPFDIYDLEKNGYQISHIIGPEYYEKRKMLFYKMDFIYDIEKRKIHNKIYLIQINKEGLPVYAKSYDLENNIESDNVDRSIDCVKEFVMTMPVIQVTVSENFDINIMSLFLRNMSKLEKGYKFLFLARDNISPNLYREYRWYLQINRSYYPKILELSIDELNELPDIEYEKLKQDYNQDNYSLGDNPSLILYEPQYMRDNSLNSFDFYFKNKDNLPKGYYSFDFDWKKISTYRLRNIIHPKTIIATHHMPPVYKVYHPDINFLAPPPKEIYIPARTEYNCVFHRRDMDKEQSEYKKNLLANKSSWLSNEENEGFQDYRQYYLSSSRDYIPEDVVRDLVNPVFWNIIKLKEGIDRLDAPDIIGMFSLGYEIGFCMNYDKFNYSYSKKISIMFSISNYLIMNLHHFHIRPSMELFILTPYQRNDPTEESLQYFRTLETMETNFWTGKNFLKEFRGDKIANILEGLRLKTNRQYKKGIKEQYCLFRYNSYVLYWYIFKDILRLCKKYINDINIIQDISFSDEENKELHYFLNNKYGPYVISQNIYSENHMIYKNSNKPYYSL